MRHGRSNIAMVFVVRAQPSGPYRRRKNSSRSDFEASGPTDSSGPQTTSTLSRPDDRSK
jgi:hypothetical protein